MAARVLVVVTCCLLPLLAQAELLISVEQRFALASLCRGTALQGWTATVPEPGVLIATTEGDLHPAHHMLPDALRADSFSAAGLVLCVTELDSVLETCNINLFFSNLPRIRRNYRLFLMAVRLPQQERARTTLAGDEPPTCSNAGTLQSGQTQLSGAAPSNASLLNWLASKGAVTADDDGDGFTNLRELIMGTSATNAASPAASVEFLFNGRNSIQIDSGEPFNLQLHYTPGNKQGLLTDYYVGAYTNGQTWSWIPSQGFIPTATRQLSFRGPAMKLDKFTLQQIAGLPVGEYRLYFQTRAAGISGFEIDSPLIVQTPRWQFVNVTRQVGINHSHGFSRIDAGIARDRQLMIAGVAAGDYDNDGWTDLYITRGSAGPNLLYRNLGNGTYKDMAANAGVALIGEYSGATFADYDGDKHLDLLVGGINQTEQVRLFRNNGNGTFTDATVAAGMPLVSQFMSASFGDYDKDSDLDLWMTHWHADTQHNYLLRNNLSSTGNASLTDVSVAAGIPDDAMNDFTTHFADIDNDTWPDILVAADFHTSQIFSNQRNSTFKRTTGATISDENGMGAAVGDYDNDGDLDWFVSSIHDERPNALNLGKELLGITWGITGNRLYRNRGDGSFDDVTDFAGVRNGGWGWGSCFADFDNDGWLDLFHVNGYDSSVLGSTIPFPFRTDASRLFINDQHGGFRERSVELGISDNGQGRGIVCFDHDRDGDIDIFVANNAQAPLLYENRGLQRHWLQVAVRGEGFNSEAIGARVYITAGGRTQMRELSAGSNFMSQNPVLAHFGLGLLEKVESVRVLWPSGRERVLTSITADQRLSISP